MPIAKKRNNTLVLFASPHEQSYTKKAVDMIIESMSICEPTILNMYDQVILPCIDCKACTDDACIFNEEDDMCTILKAISNSDVIIIATPIYFNSVPASLKLFIDRLEQFFIKMDKKTKENSFHEKTGVLITTMGSDEEYITDSIYAMFEQVFNLLSCDFSKYYFISETDKAQDIILKEYLK